MTKNKSDLMKKPLLLGCALIVSSFCGQSRAESGLSIPVTPWMEQDTAERFAPVDIPLQQISINDLQDAPALTTRNTKTPPIVSKPSALETLYSGRIVDELEQYGYDLFDTAADLEKQRLSMPAGTISSDYILSKGDTLDIIVRGQVNNQSQHIINNQGMLIVDDFTPLNAAGKSIEDIRTLLQAETGGMHNTQIYVSLSNVRQIGVLVVGHVKKPGRKNLTAFHTALDALSLAGGVDKTGSLRQIKLVRGGKSHMIDLYHLLMANGSGADKLLQDGDRLIVPPIGPTMAVSGAVKRTGIYELNARDKISLHQALALSGGLMTPGQSRYMKMEFTSNGEETIQEIATSKQRLFGDGSILMVAQSEQKQASAVTLSGHTRQPGTHDLKKSNTLSALINDSKVLGKDIYPLIGIVERIDANQLTKDLIAFSPRGVLKQQQDQKLKEGDIVHLFSMDEIRRLDPDHNTVNPLLHQASLNAAQSAIDEPIIAAFLTERSAFVRGAVRQSGAYPITKDTTLGSVLAVAGGMSLEANKESIEVTSRGHGRKTIDLKTTNPSDVKISAGDTVRVNQKFHKINDQSVMLLGEVNHPGRYDLMPGDTMLKLMERAGGLTEQGYADGAIFSRAAERKREQSRYKAQAQDLEMKLAASLQAVKDDKKPDMTQVSATQSLIAQLKSAQAVGRITVEADPASLTADPAQDILLEAGDKIFIPKRPLTVRVTGEVLSPAALQFKSGKDPLDYIREAGGTTYYADKDRAFVIYPDGSAQPLSISAWNHRTTMIPPGSMIIVPRDPKPFDFLESAERVSTMLANLAISGLYIEAIGDND